MQRRRSVKQSGPNKTRATAAPSVADLQEQVGNLSRELKEALQRQSATTEVLQVINRSTGNLVPVFDSILEKAHSLCGVTQGSLQLYDGSMFRAVAVRGLSGPFADRLREGVRLDADAPGPYSLKGARFIHIHDLCEADDPVARAAFELAGVRTLLLIPLRKDGALLGRLSASRPEVKPFTPKEIAILEDFAAQAIVAMDTARLFNETREALERQTATADILKVIATSPSDVQPVFDAIAASANRLMHAHATTVWRRSVDGMVHLAALTPVNPTADAALRARSSFSPSSSLYWHLIQDGNPAQFVDTEKLSPGTGDPMRELGRARGFRSLLVVPLMSEGAAIGSINVTRATAGSFADADVQLLLTFADQAVIAIENARLFNEVQAKTRDLTESLEQQTATGDVLKVISRSAFDLEPALIAICKTAARLCEADQAAIFTREGDRYRFAASFGFPPEYEADWRAAGPRVIDPNSPLPGARCIRERRPVQVLDLAADPAFHQTASRQSEARTALGIPLFRDGEPIGNFALGRRRVEAFSDRHIELVQTFADQAVIAIENARLFNETKEALARQTATADVLKVIASSPSKLKPVFDAIAERSKELIGGHSTTVFRFVGDMVELVGATSVDSEADAVLRATFPMPLSRMSSIDRVLRGETAEIVDAMADSEPDSSRQVALARGWRSRIVVPLKGDNEIIGFISITRKETGGFAEKDVELVRTFADQAVIAIKNVELFEEVQARTRDLEESLQQQTATADVLKVISRAAFDLQAVLDTLVESAARLCEAEHGIIVRPRGQEHRVASSWGLPPETKAYLESRQFVPGEKSASGQALLEGRIIHVEDVFASPDYILAGDSNPARTRLAVRLLREGRPIGVFSLTRQQVHPFTDKQIELVQTFADQAVIAIENTRLFKEVQARTSDLEESLQQQTATADVLKVISRSAFDLQSVLETLIRSAVELSDAFRGTIYLREGDLFRFRAASYDDINPAWLDFLRSNPAKAGRHSAAARAIATGQTVCIPDLLADPEIQIPANALAGIRAVVAVPLLRGGKVEGVMILSRQTPGPFTVRQIELVQTFADQAVIAIENARLFDEVQARTKELAASLDHLRTAQDRLIQTEKLASLGQLTAGIAHEIKNPLNFVNNFSALSVELTDELNELLGQAELTGKLRQEVGELTALLRDNLSKIVQHGKRADSIVKNMLLHSRQGSGDYRAADINALVDESLNLAYHGARAENSQFNVTLKRDFDPNAGIVEVFPQEITRVLLNLISNGFYAVTKRKADKGGSDYEPQVTATTRGDDDHVEIRIRDNGIGIPRDVKDKIFNPFFTTKPAGEGTGLGLSMSHDIVVKQHGGRIDVETEPGVFTEFIITLQRTGVARQASGGTK